MDPSDDTRSPASSLEHSSGSTELRPIMNSHDNSYGKRARASIQPYSDVSIDSNTLDNVLSPQVTTTSLATEQPLTPSTTYKVYKRRWFGLIQLTLLNIIVSWDWLTFAPVSTTSAQYFSVTESTINWLSTAFLFAFVAATPFVMWTLNSGGPKPAIIVSSALTLVGNWIRYGGTKGGNFGVVMFGQILIGLAQPFVLAAPTRYSDLWFTERGRITATAVATLANPLGGALGQLIDPFWATQRADIPNMVLYVAIISSIATLPSPFFPRSPPSPPSATSMLAATDAPLLNLKTLGNLFTSNTSFVLLFVPFTIYVSGFNALSSLLNAVLYPYGFTETTAGLTGALLILVGLVTAAITSPILDRNPGWRLMVVKSLVLILAAMYLAFIFAPATRSVAAPYAIASLLGAASFSLVPLALEMLVEVTWPVSPEVSSCVSWAAGQLGGGVLIVIMDAMQGIWKDGEPNGNMKAGLVFLAIISWLVAPLPLLLGRVGRGWTGRGNGRVEMR